MPERMVFQYEGEDLRIAATCLKTTDQHWKAKLARHHEGLVPHELQPGKRYLPPLLAAKIVQGVYESPLGEHQGVAYKVQPWYDRPKLLSAVTEVVETCDVYRRATTERR